jgi:hypothetical protein
MNTSAIMWSLLITSVSMLSVIKMCVKMPDIVVPYEALFITLTVGWLLVKHNYGRKLKSYVEHVE